MQRPEELLIALMKKSEVDFTASLPCEKIKTLLEMVGNTFRHIPLTREEEGVGICAGAALAGRRPAMFIQSSGIGNMINALLSLTQFYELPLALFVSRRGVYKEKIEAQVPMGQRLHAIFSGAGITSTEINRIDDLASIDRDLPSVFQQNKIHAFLLSPALWEQQASGIPQTIAPGFRADSGDRDGETEHRPGSPAAYSQLHAVLTRYDVIKRIAPNLGGKVVVSNLGWPSKELYAIKHQHSNFYMLGSMGMVTPIGLGIALATSKEVVVIDGDGSLLMNPGTLATIAALAPNNLTIIAIDNRSYGSTGNQPTLTGTCVDLEQVARGFGFTNTSKAATDQDLTRIFQSPARGPFFVHVLAVPGNKDVPNIPVHHLEIKKNVQEFLRK